MRVYRAILFVCTASLFFCPSVKSVNDTNIDDKSFEGPENLEMTTIDATVAEIMEDTETTQKERTATGKVIEKLSTNSTTENVTDTDNKKSPKVTTKSLFTENMENYWMKVKGNVRKELMDVQAVLVKDEEVTKSCQEANLNAKTRYLMCGGSIISDHYVLTSASCLHEATHIRHNIKAPLAIVVGPTKSSGQLIRVQDYVIHPQHQTDPYGPNHLKHNLALLKLACRIKPQNLKKIKYPESPFTELCSSENCIVALFRKLGKSSYQVQEVIAEGIPLSKRKRDQSAVLQSSMVSNTRNESSIKNTVNFRKPRKLIDPPRFDNSFVALDSHTDNQNRKRNSNDADNGKQTNIQNKTVSTTMIPEENTSETEPPETMNQSIIHESAVRSIMARASDGTNRCPRTGSPVMSEDVQTALVSVPCDDRQPSKNWGYTDLFDNLDWIKAMVDNWKKPERMRSGSIDNKGSCSTCIFNFYLSRDSYPRNENSERSDCKDVISLRKKTKLNDENITQSFEIQMPQSNGNNNPMGLYTNYAETGAPALPTAYASAPLREYRSNAESNSIGSPATGDHRRSTMEKCNNATLNCTSKFDNPDIRMQSNTADMKKVSLTQETRDKILLEKFKFFNIKSIAKSIQDQTRRDVYNRQIYSQFYNGKTNIVPEALKTVYPRNDGKYENHSPRIQPQPKLNRGQSFTSNSQLPRTSGVSTFDPRLTGFLKNPKKLMDYPEIIENTNSDDSTEDHVIVVKLRIEEPRYDPLKSSNDYIEEARLKNMSITIDGDQSNNSDIYVNGKSLRNSEIYVYGEKTQNSRNYRDNANTRSFRRTTQNPKIDRTKKSTTWPSDRIVRFASATGYVSSQEEQSFVADNATMETGNDDDKGHPGRRTEIANNVANPATVRKRDIHGLLRKDRQEGRD